MENPLIVRAHLSAAERERCDSRVRAGSWHRILRGVYSLDGQETWLHRVHAAQLRHPAAVLCGRTAAKLHYWQELECDSVHLTGVRTRNSPSWLESSRGIVPSQLRVQHGPLTLTTPALTVLDLIPCLGGQAIDEALRRRAVTLNQLTFALQLTPDRVGNQLRARLITESRDNPWSELERDGHVLLRRHGFVGWSGNRPVRVNGRVFYADVAFPACRLIIEFDGWSYHRAREDLDRDNWRQNLLMLAGWTVLRYTRTTLADMPDQIRQHMLRHAASR